VDEVRTVPIRLESNRWIDGELFMMAVADHD
jgi:hypothetical protein